MLEADILMGKVKSAPGDSSDMAIMAHPPEKESDLAFDSFLDAVIEADRGKGIKLDFKDLNAVEQCLEKLKNRSTEVSIYIPYSSFYLFIINLFQRINMHCQISQLISRS